MFSKKELEPYLRRTKYVDSSPDLLRLCEKIREHSRDEVEAAVAVFYFIRDIKWGASPIYRASEALRRKEEPQICVSKAILQVALCRNIGIPARFHYWKVKFSDEVVRRINELFFSGERRKFRNAELHHVTAEVYLGEWFVADATIDKGLEPIFRANEWNGRESVLINGFDFIEDYGVYTDVPKEVIEVSRGKGLPFYMRPFFPLIMRSMNKRINQLLDCIRSMEFSELV